MLDCTIVTSGHHGSIMNIYIQTIILPRKPATGSTHDYLFSYCPQVGILFEVLRIGKGNVNNQTNNIKINDKKCFECKQHAHNQPWLTYGVRGVTGKGGVPTTANQIKPSQNLGQSNHHKTKLCYVKKL